jgi:hypothetical protein
MSDKTQTLRFITFTFLANVAALRETMGTFEATLTSIELQFYTLQKTLINDRPKHQFSVGSAPVPRQMRAHRNVVVFILSILSID